MAGCWKPLPSFLEKRGLLEMRQKGVSGPAEYPRARTALGLPRRGTLVTGGSFVPVKQEKPGGSQCCERNIHQSPRCAQQLAAPSDCGRGISPQCQVVCGQCQGWAGMSQKANFCSSTPFPIPQALPFLLHARGTLMSQRCRGDKFTGTYCSA